MKNRNMPPLTIDNMLNFWKRINKTNYCWLWTGSSVAGYGNIKINKETWLVHRISYWIYYNVDPKEFEVCHSCNNPICVNPSHLFLGTHSDNMKHASESGHFQRKGNLHPGSKLSEKQACEIIDLKGTVSSSQLAKHYNVSSGLIRAIQNRRAWSHL